MKRTNPIALLILLGLAACGGTAPADGGADGATTDLAPAAGDGAAPDLAAGSDGGGANDAGTRGDAATPGDATLPDLMCSMGPVGDLLHVPPLRVTVKNAKDGSKICDAKVTSKSGSMIQVDLWAGNCMYTGGHIGANTVEASKMGWKSASKAVTVPLGGDCHPVQQDVTLELTPN